MSKKTLLELALEFKSQRAPKSTFSPEQVELAIAWMNDEITMTQLQKVTGAANVYVFIAMAVRQWFRDGMK